MATRAPGASSLATRMMRHTNGVRAPSLVATLGSAVKSL
jgi:hypothetical protein